MSQEPPTIPEPRSWLERISQALSNEPKNRNELLEILRDAQARNLFDLDSLMMIEGVLKFSTLKVRDIMIPRAQIIFIQQDENIDNLLPKIIESGHSRFPVIGNDLDDIVGILLAKDLLKAGLHPPETFHLEEFLREVSFVPESKLLNMLLRDFKRKRNHLAIVVDEYGGISGLVTIEDVLEEIVGEIEDEYDIDDGHFIRQHSENLYILKAQTPLQEFNEYFKTKFSDPDIDTIGGIILKGMGYLPKQDEVFTLDHMRFRIIHADTRRLHLLELTLMNKT